MIGSCLLQYGYSFKSKNNCYSVYMNKTFCGHTPKVNGLLNLDRSDTHIHNIDAKRCKVDNDSATYLWHFRLGHIGVKRMTLQETCLSVTDINRHSSAQNRQALSSMTDSESVMYRASQFATSTLRDRNA